MQKNIYHDSTFRMPVFQRKLVIQQTIAIIFLDEIESGFSVCIVIFVAQYSLVLNNFLCYDDLKYLLLPASIS